jgi:hypothetical protein
MAARFGGREVWVVPGAHEGDTGANGGRWDDVDCSTTRSDCVAPGPRNPGLKGLGVILRIVGEVVIYVRGYG